MRAHFLFPLAAHALPHDGQYGRQLAVTEQIMQVWKAVQFIMEACIKKCFSKILHKCVRP